MDLRFTVILLLLLGFLAFFVKPAHPQDKTSTLTGNELYQRDFSSRLMKL
jgi:hypothetical protein